MHPPSDPAARRDPHTGVDPMTHLTRPKKYRILLTASLPVALLAVWFVGNPSKAEKPKVNPSKAVPPEAKVDFHRDIRPILSDNCFACHGPDPKARKKKLRLDIREAAIKHGVLVPGK